MAGKVWSQEDLDYLKKHGPTTTCETISAFLGRTLRSVRHKFDELGIEKERAKIGDVVNGWEILDIYERDIGTQKVSIAEVISTLDRKTVKEYRLTLLSKGKVGWPDRRRPDVSEKNKTHGLSKHPLYVVYCGMINRCYNEKQLSYKNYGAKGITVCDEWKNDFQKFYDWAIENGWEKGLQIDREKNHLGYSPNNCRIVTRKFNIDNRSVSLNITAFGETKNASDWALDSRCKCTYWSLMYRINAGWESEKAITKPSKGKQNFKRYKSLYKYILKNHSEILEKFNEIENNNQI